VACESASDPKRTFARLQLAIFVDEAIDLRRRVRHNMKSTLTISALTFLASFLASPEAFASGHAPAIGRLLDAECPDYNLSVYAPKKSGDDSVFSGDCVLAFARQDESEGTDALIRLNGSVMHLLVIRKTARYPNVRYEFADRAGALKASMNIKEDCPDGVEGCDFTGTLTVVSSGRRSTVHVVYYRGG
jgi:hypothetical protein